MDIPKVPTPSSNKRPGSKSGAPNPKEEKKEYVNSFKECISAFSKNLEMKSSTCEELQELFFKLAGASKTLPSAIDTETVDSFLAILVTVISVNYGYQIALQALSVLFTYLKNDDRVFNQFKPSREILLQLNFDKYLSSIAYLS
jgi:hypothetical protein